MLSKIKAPAFRYGDTIGIFSPSAAATVWIPERTQLALSFLEHQGCKVKCGSLTGKADVYRSGFIAERAEELNALIRDPDVRCIMAASGGMVANSILPYIDYESLRRDPKILVGYSDVTAVLLAVYEKAGLIPFYGPHLISVFGEAMPYAQESWHYFSQLAFGVALPHAYRMPPVWTEDSVGAEEEGVECAAFSNEWVCVHAGRVRGRLIGGNLDTLCGVWGSPYMPVIAEGDILFLEETRGTPERLERAFSHMALCGVFDRIGGLLLGKCADYSTKGSGRKPWEILLEILEKYQFPILAEFDCAHTKPMLTLPIGCQYELDAGEKRVSLIENAVG